MRKARGPGGSGPARVYFAFVIDRIFRKYLEWTGQGYLVPFLDGLAHLGRPSAVFFPYELLGQGLAIVLSGLNNTMAIQSNLGWVWPYWVERQIDPDAPDFVPTAINLIKTNLTARNWTAIGLPTSEKESLVDPVGMLTLRPYGWSVFPYVKAADGSFFPPRMSGRVFQTLRNGSDPFVVTRYESVKGLAWECEAGAVEAEGEELISYHHSLRNHGERPLELTFGLAIRPYNPLMIGHINTIRFKNRLWRMNGSPGLLLLEEPDRVAVSDRHQGDPLGRPLPRSGPTYLRSRSGIACGACEWDIRLEPGRSRSFEALGPLAKDPRKQNTQFRDITPDTLKKGKLQRLEQIGEEAKKGLQVRLPDGRLQRAFEAVRAHLHVFDDGTHFSPGNFLYHTHWFRDSAFIALAFENMGLGERVAPKVPDYLSRQTADGFFKSQQGEWDSNGEAIWSLVNHVRMGGETEILDRVFPALLKGVKWIESMRGKNRKSPGPHHGLLPAGFSAEHFGPNDHYYWDNFWSLGGMKAALWAASRLGRRREEEWLLGAAADYEHDIRGSMEWAFAKLGSHALPTSPYRWLDSAAIGNLIALSPLGLAAPEEPWARATVDYLLENNLRDGLFFQKIVHTGLNPYLSAQLARTLFQLGDERGFDMLLAILDAATPTYTWPEALHPRVKGGCMGDGDHGWAAAEFLSLIREMLVREEALPEPALLLGEGLPAAWFRPGLSLEVKNAPTRHGEVTYALTQDAAGLRVAYSVKRRAHQEAVPLFLSLPRKTGLAPPDGKNRVIGSRLRLALPGKEEGQALFHSLSSFAPSALRIPA